MAGRGRGRGRGAKGTSLSLETLGIGRGEVISAPVLQPRAIYPPLEFKPVPLLKDDDYLVEWKKEYRNAMKDSPYFITMPEAKTDIERYSDKYQMNGQDNNNVMEPDWSRLPVELKPRKKRRTTKSTTQPALTSLHLEGSKAPVDVEKTFEHLEKKEDETVQEEDKEGDEKGEEGDDDDMEDDFFDDEEEEENDYNLNYFDNGEGYGMDDDDDLDEGPTY